MLFVVVVLVLFSSFFFSFFTVKLKMLVLNSVVKYLFSFALCFSDYYFLYYIKKIINATPVSVITVFRCLQN